LTSSVTVSFSKMSPLHGVIIIIIITTECGLFMGPPINELDEGATRLNGTQLPPARLKGQKVMEQRACLHKKDACYYS